MAPAPNGPAEIFGYAIHDTSEEAKAHREAHLCPFTGSMCWKQSRELDVPFGICTVRYQDELTATCPSRLLEDKRVFKDIAQLHFGSLDNLMVFSEVGARALAQSGSYVTYTFDYVLVKHYPLSAEIEDFVVVEFQTVDTTNTGGLVDAFTAFQQGTQIQNRKWKFGMNWKNVWKRCFTQILQKGLVLERWGHKIFWVAQPSSYRRLKAGYGLGDLSYDPSDSTVFMLYEQTEVDRGYRLRLVEKTSATADGLFRAFQEATPIPTRSSFMKSLEERVAESSTSELHLRLEME